MRLTELAKDMAKRIVPARLRYLGRKVLNFRLRGLNSVQYWTQHNVTEHRRFATAQASIEYFNWRNSQYPGYIGLLPVSRADGKTVLDFGCGPGNDLVGFSVFSKPARLIGVDVSSSSLAEAKARLAVHGATATELVLLSDSRLPFADQSIDLIHSSGVLHHLPDIDQALHEFRRVLKKDGYCQIMVYNANSIWLHLYAGYIYKKMFPWRAGIAKKDVFKVTTDGEECPIVNCYTPEEFIAIGARNGFKVEFIGAAISLNELMWLNRRLEALKDEKLDPDSREFLLNLTFDDRQFPRFQGQVAGIDACFRFSLA